MGFGAGGDTWTDLLAGMGTATPAPLFLIDDEGRARPLNRLASDLPDDHALSSAIVSPVAAGSERRGSVVAYLGPEPAESEELVATLVALTAELVGRGLGAPAARQETLDAAPVAPSDGLDAVTDVAAVAQAIVTAARAATGAARVAVLTASPDGRLETAACGGVTRVVASVGGLLQWAASRTTVTAVASPWRLPADAPRESGDDSPLLSWLATPFVLVPLRSGAHRVGLLCVSGLLPQPGRDASAEAAAGLAALADRASAALAGALVLRHARREEQAGRDLEIARQIHRRLLPREVPSFPGLQLAGGCRTAAQVGGDWYGFRAEGDEAMLASMFDVAGHGVGAAFCMTLVRSSLRAELSRGGTLADVLARTNSLAAEDLAESGLFATAVLARIHADGRLEVASAGHCRPIHWSAGSRRFVEHRQAGLPLGLFGDSRYAGDEGSFAEGDVLVLYTDGIAEALSPGGEPFGRSRLLALVRKLRRRSASRVLAAAWKALDQFTGGAPLRDDATLVVIRGGQGFGTREPAGSARRRRESAAVTAVTHGCEAACGREARS